jgi:catechol 2,3-dioxygenase-like lactoylglutathione lyase family enzyme
MGKMKSPSQALNSALTISRRHQRGLIFWIMVFSHSYCSWSFIPISFHMRSFASIRNYQMWHILHPYASTRDLSLESSPSPLPSLSVHHAALQVTNMTRSLLFYSSLLGLSVVSQFRAGPAKAVWLSSCNSGSAATTTTSSRDMDSDTQSSLSSDDDIPNNDNHGSTEPTTLGMCLELIEIPLWISSTTPNRRAFDVIRQPTYVGPHHVALDVTAQIQSQLCNNNSSSFQNAATIITAADTANSTSMRSSPLSDWLTRLNATSVERFGKALRVAVPPRQQMIGRDVYELAFLYDPDGCLVELISWQSRLAVSASTSSWSSGWTLWDGTGFVGPSTTTSDLER